MTDFDMNSFQNVFSACVDEQLLESGGKIGTWTSLSFLGQERGNKLWMDPSCKAKRHMKLALPYLTRLLNGESSHQSNKWGWALFIFGGANYKQAGAEMGKNGGMEGKGWVTLEQD